MEESDELMSLSIPSHSSIALSENHARAIGMLAIVGFGIFAVKNFNRFCGLVGHEVNVTETGDAGVCSKSFWGQRKKKRALGAGVRMGRFIP
jgi:NADH pyrophosphatase NudC (nudix superfamily)